MRSPCANVRRRMDTAIVCRSLSDTSAKSGTLRRNSKGSSGMRGAYATALGRATARQHTGQGVRHGGQRAASALAFTRGGPPARRARSHPGGRVRGGGSGDLEGALHPRVHVRVALERVRALLEGHGDLLRALERHARDHLVDSGPEDVEVVRGRLVLDGDRVLPMLERLDGLAALRE